MMESKQLADKRKSTKPRDPNVITADRRPDEDEAVALARNTLRPTVRAAVTLRDFGKSFGELDLSGLIDSLTEQVRASSNGDLERAEAMLTTQAIALDAIFNNLASRAALNAGEYIGACETYLKLALRAQAQCRSTLEALAAIRHPPIAGYIRQANVSAGPQQVVNHGGVAPEAAIHTLEKQNRPNKLLEAIDGNQLDIGATGPTGRTDSEMATVGEIDRPKDRGR